MDASPIPELTDAQKAGFYDKVMVTDTCHIWTGSVNRSGYGQVSVGGRGKKTPKLAHRVAFKLAKGEDPGASLVLHSCDQPACVAPYHLRLGTQRQNMQECRDRGRLFGGAPSQPHNRGLGRFNTASVLLVKWALERGAPIGMIADAFGVRPGQISAIKTGSRWGSVE